MSKHVIYVQLVVMYINTYNKIIKQVMYFETYNIAMSKFVVYMSNYIMFAKTCNE